MIFNCLVALIGSLLAGIEDLKTTEISDEIPTLMAAFGLFYWFIFSLQKGFLAPAFNSVLTGFILLAFGWLFYRTGQWGGGDAKLLSAFGFLFPYTIKSGSMPFIITFTLNLFLVGAIYMVVYIALLGLKNQDIIRDFLKRIKKNKKLFFISIGIWLVSYTVLDRAGFATISYTLSCVFFFTSLIIILFWLYAKSVESVEFVKRIPVSELKEGDVLYNSKKWDGITKEELKHIKKSKKFVKIKEGVRFGPSFFLTLVVTYYYGFVLQLII